MEKFALSSEGTVEELRRRLRNFLREGVRTQPEPKPQERVKPPPIEPHPTLVQLSTSPQPSSQVVPDLSALNQVRKWNVTFNGKADAVAFIERVEELADSYQIPNGQLLRALPELLRKQAILWYRNNKQQWNSWYDFLADFKSYYFPPEFRDDLEEEISRRMQHETEPGKYFLVHMQTLIRRHGGYSKERELQVIYLHPRPEYRQYIRS
ncbi:hypothetical protein BDFB_010911 [Asbolus verrucosus]|uniref:Retrotransposon gag domain-containing protein n=1 Tax=Asbolus verrucosus TaxID=1661398 RepID=A0A482VT24_ASBVE|nr:hypothetical protein BDFB_010911 [Asbolus verrucosus]